MKKFLVLMSTLLIATSSYAQTYKSLKTTETNKESLAIEILSTEGKISF